MKRILSTARSVIKSLYRKKVNVARCGAAKDVLTYQKQYIDIWQQDTGLVHNMMLKQFEQLKRNNRLRIIVKCIWNGWMTDYRKWSIVLTHSGCKGASPLKIRRDNSWMPSGSSCHKVIRNHNWKRYLQNSMLILYMQLVSLRAVFLMWIENRISTTRWTRSTTLDILQMDTEHNTRYTADGHGAQH